MPSVSLNGFEDVSVVVDASNGTFTFPIDAYLMDEESLRVVTEANNKLFETCVAAAGSSYKLEIPPDETTPTADRRYGLWNVDEAAKYGYGFPGGSNLADPTMGGSGEVPEADAQVAETCSNETDFLPSVGRGSLAADGQDPEFYLAADIMNRASQLAMGDERWAAADEEWRACLEGAGLEIVVDQDGIPLRPVVPEDPEQALRAAVSEAECSVSTDRVQKLGDLESQYQAALIAEQQAALNASLDEQKEILAEARSILDEV